jgi:outer membrane biogenesis lipoprotein LolB
MKSFLLAAAALMLVAGANLAAAEAQTNPPVRWDSSQATAQPVQQGAAGAVAPSARHETPSARYETQYHYGGSPRHPRWEPQGYTAQ